MALRSTEIHITELQWLEMHLRLAALEQNGSRLNCRFEFSESDIKLTCHIYFADDDSSSMKNISEEERNEIHEGWVAFGMSVIRNALNRAELPSTFIWNPVLKFVLYESCGMGASIVQTFDRSISWPTRT